MLRNLQRLILLSLLYCGHEIITEVQVLLCQNHNGSNSGRAHYRIILYLSRLHVHFYAYYNIYYLYFISVIAFCV